MSTLTQDITFSQNPSPSPTQGILQQIDQFLSTYWELILVGVIVLIVILVMFRGKK